MERPEPIVNNRKPQFLGYQAVSRDTIEASKSNGSNVGNSDYVLSLDSNITHLWLNQVHGVDHSPQDIVDYCSRWSFEFWYSFDSLVKHCNSLSNEIPNKVIYLAAAEADSEFASYRQGPAEDIKMNDPEFPENPELWKFCGFEIMDCWIGYSGITNSGDLSPRTIRQMNKFNLIPSLKGAKCLSKVVSRRSISTSHYPYGPVAVYMFIGNLEEDLLEATAELPSFHV